MSAMDSMKIKIQKLLNQARDSGATEAEAEIFMEKAQALLREHNLTEAQLGVTESEDHREKEEFPAYPWARNICGAIAQLYNCQYSYYTGMDQRKTSQVFKGKKGNAETARLIAEFVVRSVLKLAQKYQRDQGGDNRHARDFAVGCSNRLVNKAWALWREDNKEAIQERERKWQEKEAKRPDPANPKPGQYEVKLLGKEYQEVSCFKLDELGLAQMFSIWKDHPPEDAYEMSVRCFEGELKFDDSFWFKLKDIPPEPESKKKSKAPKQNKNLEIKNTDAYYAGSDAAENIGLRVQLGNAPKEKLNG